MRAAPQRAGEAWAWLIAELGACGQRSHGDWRCAQGITKQLQGARGQALPSSEQVVEALGRARLVLRIFFSLNSPGLTEVPARSACAFFGMSIRHACLVKGILHDVA